MMLASDKPDPLDYSRTRIAEHARRAANYADIVRDLAEMRDDEGLDVMRRRLVAEVNAMSATFKALTAGKLSRSVAA